MEHRTAVTLKVPTATRYAPLAVRSPVPRSESALDELSLVEATRPGGASSARRDHRDFTVNRRRLRDVLEVGDLVSVLARPARGARVRAPAAACHAPRLGPRDAVRVGCQGGVN